MIEVKATKRKIYLSVLLSLLLIVLAACGNENTNSSETSNADDSKIQIVTSIYPIYFMANYIGGEAVQVTNLIATGVEPHDWTPKSKDLLTATDADLLLYHGLGLETWIDSFKKGLDPKSTVVVKEISNGIELIDAAEADEEHDHEAEEDHDHEAEASETASEDAHEHSHTTDPHTWVSPKSALILAENIKNALIEVDPAQSELYEQNYAQLAAELTAIDEEYTSSLEQASQRTIVVSHQSFGYVARDYQLNQISIMGLNPNSEPRSQDILEIANTVKETGIKYIFFEELISDKLAKMLASEAKVDTLVLYSLEGLTTTQDKNGETYLTLMRQNLQNLMQALQ